MCYDEATGCECNCCQAEVHPCWQWLYDERDKYETALKEIEVITQRTSGKVFALDLLTILEIEDIVFCKGNKS